MKFNFYDIESLSNVFTLCNFKDEENIVDVFYLVDDQSLVSDPNFETNVKKAIYDANKNFNGSIELHDLRYEVSCRELAKTFGVSDAYMANNKNNKSNYPAEFRLVCDSDPEYNEDKHAYLLGYNSYNYDTTMLAMFFHEVFVVDSNTGVTVFNPNVTAKLLREYNNDLFSPRFKEYMYKRLLTTYDTFSKTWTPDDYSDSRYRIRQNMLLSGRHLDVARLNEKQSKVALKRLLGMLGYQILESDKLKQDQDTIENAEQFYDLIAYNVSDCVNLKKLFYHKFYQAQFSLKHGLLKTYPEVMYEKQKDKYAPDVSPYTVRKDRLCIDSSSAKFATFCLCPYGHLTDIPTVSFLYPSEEKAKETGVPRVNVLEESKKFFYANFPQPELRARFDVVYNYYKSLEGQNFNESKNYREDYASTNEWVQPKSLSGVPKADLCLPYFNRDGSESSCFVTFSTGGIHGAECNRVLYEDDLHEYQSKMSDMQYCQSVYPDPIELKKAKEITMPDGRVLKSTHFLKSGSTLKCSTYKKIDEPQLFKIADDGSTKLNPNYVYTSCDLAQHEDFTSYYPNLLIQMMAFYNEDLGYDRYFEIFGNKEKYGKLMKDQSLSQSDRDMYSILREGTKLILNSASGAGDTNFEGNIRMNNTIISMRIIGQLFSWRIGQAQTLEGAKITSTNTDGLYSAELEEHLNATILERESKNINVAIEPEPVYLISKDSNNRIEMDPDNGDVISASGGTLGCRKGPNPTKALAHPAIIDWALTEYLIVAALKTKPKLAIYKPFDDETGMNILKSAFNKFDKVEFLTMMQNLVASSIGSVNYIFGTTDDDPGTPIIMQHYNRVFIMKDGTPNTVHLRSANAKVITEASKKKRNAIGERPQQHDRLALSVLGRNGITLNDIPSNKEAVVKKVTNVEDTWYMFVQNKDLNYLSDEEYKFIIDNLDYEKYLKLLRDCFDKNWRNHMPEGYHEDDDIEFVEPQAEATDEEVNADTDTTSVNTPDTQPDNKSDEPDMSDFMAPPTVESVASDTDIPYMPDSPTPGDEFFANIDKYPDDYDKYRFFSIPDEYQTDSEIREVLDNIKNALLSNNPDVEKLADAIRAIDNIDGLLETVTHDLISREDYENVIVHLAHHDFKNESDTKAWLERIRKERAND